MPSPQSNPSIDHFIWFAFSPWQYERDKHQYGNHLVAGVGNCWRIYEVNEKQVQVLLT